MPHLTGLEWPTSGYGIRLLGGAKNTMGFTIFVCIEQFMSILLTKNYLLKIVFVQPFCFISVLFKIIATFHKTIIISNNCIL